MFLPFPKLITHRDALPCDSAANPCRSNVGPTASPAPNGFTDLLPANLAFVGPVRGGLGAPEGQQQLATELEAKTKFEGPSRAMCW